ncbi:MAG: radical SAM protein [Deltaproteobacteria bacterium]|nr:radical SAM protein [Deltaproteobacteria bacterium]
MTIRMSFIESIENIELSHYKWIAHIEKLTRLAKGKDVFPVTVELDLVSYCNHGCEWCVDPIHKHDTLDLSFVSELLNEFKILGIEGIVFKGGGEPTLYHLFADVIKEAKSLGFEVGIVTNGSKLEELYESIVQNASYLRVSIDGPTYESHRRIHKSNDFESIIKGVDKTVKLRNKLQKRHPIIGLSFAMDYSSVNLVGDAIGLGVKLNTNYVLLRPPFFDEVARKNTMTIDQKIDVLSVFEKKCDSYNGNMKILIDYWISDSETNALHSRDESPRRGKYIQQGANGLEHITCRCFASPLLAVVTADRKVYPCCNLRFIEDWNLGVIDYGKNNNFEKIWKSQKRKEIIDKIHMVKCIKYCTHPLSRYNEVIEYLRSKQFHKGFV